MPKGKKNKTAGVKKENIEVVKNLEETLEVTETVTTKEIEKDTAKKTPVKETNKKSQDKPKKRFFKDFKAELKKVIWPTPKQLVNNTIAVISIVLLTAVIVFALDVAFEKMNTYGINKIKTMVESKEDTTNTVTNQQEENTTENANSVENNQQENTAE